MNVIIQKLVTRWKCGAEKRDNVHSVFVLWSTPGTKEKNVIWSTPGDKNKPFTWSTPQVIFCAYVWSTPCGKIYKRAWSSWDMIF